MKDIYDDLMKDGELVNGKLVTAKSGTFLVQLLTVNEDDMPLTFLIRRSDLYVESYHYDSKYFSLFSTIYFTFSLNSLEKLIDPDSLEFMNPDEMRMREKFNDLYCTVYPNSLFWL